MKFFKRKEIMGVVGLTGAMVFNAIIVGLLRDSKLEDEEFMAINVSANFLMGCGIFYLSHRLSRQLSTEEQMNQFYEEIYKNPKNRYAAEDKGVCLDPAKTGSFKNLNININSDGPEERAPSYGTMTV